MIVTTTVDQLADAAMREAERWPARSRQRRAACHLWSSAITSRTVSGVKTAIATFGDQRTQSDALDLMHRLAAEAAAP